MELNEHLVQERVQQHHWWFVGRRQLLKDVFQKLQRQKGEQFVTAYDVGCGVGTNLSVIRSFAERVIGVESSPDAAAFAKTKGYDAVLESTVEDLYRHVSPQTADVVVLMDVMEHLKDDVIGAERLAHMLRPGGYLIVTVPAFMMLWGLQDEVGQHYRRYRIPQMCQLLQHAGFQIQHRTYFNTLLFFPILCVRQWYKRFPQKRFQSENEMNTPWVNRLLSMFFLFEMWCLRHGMRFPFGVSALVVARKL